jgi:DNA (cytosine-5)-methyltransferase 1
VDCITAGFPCQPFSQAGSRLKTDDDRWLWPHIERIIGEVEPWLIILENVPGILDGGAAPILGSLAQMGFNAEWGILAAADVGAPHKRARWFCVAVRPEYLDALADAHGRHRVEPDPIPEGSRPISSEGQQRIIRGGGRGATVADADSDGRLKVPERFTGASGPTGVNVHQRSAKSSPILNPDKAGLERAGEQRRSTLSSGGADWWEIESFLGRVADGVAYRVDRLRACGNGVVPLQAAHAVRSLCGRLLDGGGDR